MESCYFKSWLLVLVVIILEDIPERLADKYL